LLEVRKIKIRSDRRGFNMFLSMIRRIFLSMILFELNLHGKFPILIQFNCTF